MLRKTLPMRDSGCGILDTGCGILDSGFWMWDSGCGILDTGSIVILSHPASRILYQFCDFVVHRASQAGQPPCFLPHLRLAESGPSWPGGTGSERAQSSEQAGRLNNAMHHKVTEPVLHPASRILHLVSCILHLASCISHPISIQGAACVTSLK